MKLDKKLYNKALNLLKDKTNERLIENNKIIINLQLDEEGYPIKTLVISKSEFNLININVIKHQLFFSNNSFLHDDKILEWTSVHKIWNYKYYNKLNKYF